ncbi:MAG: FAD-binding oxidoreductase [Variibacter sp.]|nr:FAD-binding oxidoreductase [Variibacter sp.]
MRMAAAEAPFLSGWYGATAAPAHDVRTVPGDVDADVCVIGGGIAGLTVARELARRDWSVVLLEAGRIGAATTADGAGIVTPGFSEPLERLIERLGLDDAKAVWRLSVDGAAYVRGVIAEAEMAAATPVAGHLSVQLRDDARACMHAAAFLRQVMAIDAEAWPAERVRDLLRSGLHHQAVYLPDAFHVHPLNYVLGLAAAARAAGARIYEQSPVLAVDASGIRRRVDVQNARVRARHIVLAASRGNQALHPALAGTIITLAQPLAVTAPLGASEREAVRFRGAISHYGTHGRSHRLVAEDRLLWCGPLRAALGAPRPGPLQRQIVRVYPQLRGLALEQAWIAAADYTVHRMPQIGELSEGLWVAGAFGRQGIAAATMAGLLIAAAINTQDDRWRLFQPYGLVWTAGRFGRAFAGTMLAASRARLRWRDSFSRRKRAAAPPEPDPEQPPLPAFDLAADRARRARRELRAQAATAATLVPMPTPAVEAAAAAPFDAAADAARRARRDRRAGAVTAATAIPRSAAPLNEVSAPPAAP